MPQVNHLLDQLDQGKSVLEAIREEKRRARKQLDRNANKLKKLKILYTKEEVNEALSSIMIYFSSVLWIQIH